MPSMDGPWIHCIPGMLYWWIWQPCHQWMGHGIPVGYCTQSGGSGNHAINGWAMVFLGYCTGGSDNHAINGWAMESWDTLLVDLTTMPSMDGPWYSWDTLLVDLATIPSMDGPWIHCIPGILYWWIWPPCHQWMGRGLGYFTGGSGHHAINGWAVDSLYSWDTLLVDLATMPSMDGPWIHCIPGILYWWIWQPCHQWRIHGFIVFLGYFTGGSGNHAINGWAVDSVYSWDTLLVDLATMPSMEDPWIHCIPGILYWWIWQPCHQWMGRGFSVFLGYFTGGSGNHAINGWAVDSLYSWDTLLVDLATMPSMEDPWIYCIPGILYWWIWQPCHQWMGRGFSVFLGYFTGGSGNHAINGWAVDSVYSWNTLLVDLATMPSMEDPWIHLVDLATMMGRGFVVFLGYFTGGSGNHAINGGSMDSFGGHHTINGWPVDSLYSWDTLLVDLATMPSMDGPWIQCIPGILYWWI